MIRGIAIFGLNGGGKSTLTHALAKEIDYFEMDVEDYYFPEQSESRKWALENNSVIDTEYLGEIPFSKPRTKSEVQNAIIEDIKTHPKFILSGVTMNWSEEVLSCIDIAFWVQTPLEERLRRIQAREEKRFGARVLAGGDMFIQQMEFRKVVANRDTKSVEECAMNFTCPVIMLDGTLPVVENLEKMKENIKLSYRDVCSYNLGIEKMINTTEYTMDTIGMSGSSIFLFDDKVLKIEEDWYESENEFQVIKWLNDKLPVPEVMCREKKNGMSHFLMSKIPGKMLCDDMYLMNPEKLVDLLVKAQHMLWQVDISDCPFDAGIDKKLKMAKYNLEHDNVDLDNVEPETFGEGGFENAEALLDWLIRNKPEEELVFTHGDFCLPNILAKDDEISGFIDWGRAGVADKYQDIAICYRSLKHNFEGKYGGEKYVNFNPDILFEKLGITPDWDKIKYYILLDELF